RSSGAVRSTKRKLCFARIAMAGIRNRTSNHINCVDTCMDTLQNRVPINFVTVECAQSNIVIHSKPSPTTASASACRAEDRDELLLFTSTELETHAKETLA